MAGISATRVQQIVKGDSNNEKEERHTPGVDAGAVLERTLSPANTELSDADSKHRPPQPKEPLQVVTIDTLPAQQAPVKRPRGRPRKRPPSPKEEPVAKRPFSEAQGTSSTLNSGDSSASNEASTNTVETELKTEDGKAEPNTGDASQGKKLDLQKPIALTSETVVVVGGKKCVLRVDPQSSQLVAYPVKAVTTGTQPLMA